MRKYYLAIDIGASSGRHIVGWREDGEIKAKEVYRFPNGVQEQDGHLIWDIDALLSHVKAGIAAAKTEFSSIISLSIDTWGVDYVLLRGEERIVPSGRTVLQAGDVAVLSARAFVEPAGLLLTEQAIAADSPWAEKRIAEFSPSGGELVILILRNSKTVIPKGDTRIKAGDVLVIASQEEALIQA